MATPKAGCFLLKLDTKEVGIVYRKLWKDYSFPKGHVEEGESFSFCAIRETEEETGRKCELLREEPLYIENYTTSKGEACECHYFIAKDMGPSTQEFPEELKEELHFVPFDKVWETLSYASLKDLWRVCEPTLLQYFE